MKLLHVDASVTGAQSVSRGLSSAVVKAWRASEPGLQLVYRDLARTVPPQLTEAALKVIKFGAEPAADTPARDLAFMEELLVEFLTADAVVIGAPMYNFTVPTQLKGWLDALAQPGRTFAYTPQGPKGLATGKRVIIASARGGSYSQPPMNARDFQEPYLIAVLNFMGITDIKVVRAEGLNMPGRRDRSIEQARRDISVLFGVPQAAPIVV